MAPRSDERQPVWSEPWQDEFFCLSFFLRLSSVSFDRQPAGKWRSWWNYTAQALGNICVPFGKYHEMRPHYAAEIHCSSAQSISSRAGDKKQLNVLLRSKRNSGHNLLRGGKNSEFQWLRDDGDHFKKVDQCFSRVGFGSSALQTNTSTPSNGASNSIKFLEESIQHFLCCSLLYFLAIRNVTQVDPCLFLIYTLRGWFLVECWWSSLEAEC